MCPSSHQSRRILPILLCDRRGLSNGPRVGASQKMISRERPPCTSGSNFSKKKKKNAWPFNFLFMSDHLIDLSAKTAPVPRRYRAMEPWAMIWVCSPFFPHPSHWYLLSRAPLAWLLATAPSVKLPRRLWSSASLRHRPQTDETKLCLLTKVKLRL